MIITEIAGTLDSLYLGNRTRHIAEFTQLDMQKNHQRFCTSDHIDVAISLDDGCQLQHNDILMLSDTDYVLVQAALEEVFVITPSDNLSWGKTCYNIGNMHQKAYFHEQSILVPYDHILEHILKKICVPYSVEKRRIIGEKANISSREHAQCSHSH